MDYEQFKAEDAHLFAACACRRWHTENRLPPDADEDIALALLFASKKWNSEYYGDLEKK
jgi:endo-1,4-beta-D-glucanase Y